ncbi:MAG: 2Fe-2S iron-sulfur cluster-binding protein [Flavobacteriales bacterium]
MKTLIVHINSKSHTIQTDKNYSILSICKRNNIPAPHSCFEGRCGLCKAKLITGNVKGQVLRIENSKRSILTCQSKMASDLLEIEY